MGSFLSDGHRENLPCFSDFIKVSTSFDTGNGLKHMRHNMQHFWETLPSFAFTRRVWFCCMASV